MGAGKTRNHVDHSILNSVHQMGFDRDYRRRYRADFVAQFVQLPGRESVQMVSAHNSARYRSCDHPGARNVDGIQIGSKGGALYRDNFYHCLWLSHLAGLGKYSQHYRRHHLRDHKWQYRRASRDHRLSLVRISWSLYLGDFRADCFLLDWRQLRKSANAFPRSGDRTFAWSIATNHPASRNV